MFIFLKTRLLENRVVYAAYDGKVVTEEDVQARVGRDIAQLERNIFELKRQTVRAIIEERVIPTAKHAPVGTPEPITKEEFKKFLIEHNLGERKLNKVEVSNIASVIRNSHRSAELRAQTDETLSRIKIRWSIPMPNLPDAELKAKPIFVTGSYFSPISVQFVGNFHCPLCKQGLLNLRALQAEFKDKARIGFLLGTVESPSSLVFQSIVAAICSDQQGKLVEFIDSMTDSAPQSEADLIQTTDRISVQRSQFEACRKDPQTQARVQSDSTSLASLDTRTAPYFVLNRKLVSAAEPREYLFSLIEPSL